MWCLGLVMVLRVGVLVSLGLGMWCLVNVTAVINLLYFNLPDDLTTLVISSRFCEFIGVVNNLVIINSEKLVKCPSNFQECS